MRIEKLAVGVFLNFQGVLLRNPLSVRLEVAPESQASSSTPKSVELPADEPKPGQAKLEPDHTPQRTGPECDGRPDKRA